MTNWFLAGEERGKSSRQVLLYFWFWLFISYDCYYCVLFFPTTTLHCNWSVCNLRGTCCSCSPPSHSLNSFDLHVCVYVCVGGRERERERGVCVWLFNIKRLEPSEMFPSITEFIMSAAVLLFVCACVCARARARACLSACVCSLAEEMKSILRLCSSLKSSASSLTIQFSIFSLSAVYPHPPPQPKHDQFFQSSLLSLPPLSLRVCFMMLAPCFSAGCWNWSRPNCLQLALLLLHQNGSVSITG